MANWVHAGRSALSSSSPNLHRKNDLTQKEGILGIPIFVEIGSPGWNSQTTGGIWAALARLAHFPTAPID
jgi:hypothetical protein